jgi:hypothetical protein
MPSKKFTQETLCKLLELLCEKPVLAKAARAVGITPNHLSVYLRQSASGDERFLVRWPTSDSEPIPFHLAVVEARKMSVVHFEAAMRNEVLNGIPRTLVHNGEIVYRLREDIVLAGDAHRSADELQLLWGVTHPYELDVEGHRIPVEVFDSAPAALKNKLLESLIPSVYGQRSETNVNIQGGVMRVAVNPPKQLEGPMSDPTQNQSTDTALVRDLRQRLRDKAAAGPGRPGLVSGSHPDDRIPDDQPEVRPPAHAQPYTPSTPAPSFQRHAHPNVAPGGFKVR